MPSPPLLVGLDCAAAPVRVGLALAEAAASRPRLLEIHQAATWPALTARVAGWIAASPGSTTLLCLDAPLGWPRAMGPALAAHRAGAPLPHVPDAFFGRLADQAVAARLGKRPLEVGANYLARAALVSLHFLESIRQAARLPIPLAWEPRETDRVRAIEVYPAGVLAGRGHRARGYKKTPEARRETRRRMEAWLDIPPSLAADLDAGEHLLDAALCCLAGADFLAGTCPGPEADQRETARVEGWIWVRRLDPMDVSPGEQGGAGGA